jgi:biopolymer transport protein ExbB
MGVLVAGVLAAGWLPHAWAQAAGAGGAAEGVGGFAAGWRELMEKGGWLMYVLLAMSLLGLALVIYFFVVLRVSQVAPRPLQRELADRIRSGAMEEARRACEYRSCPLAAVTLSALDYVRDIPSPNPELLRDVIEGAGGRQAEAIQGQTQYLLDIAAVAPMIGLLGTVFGMLRAFSGVAEGLASAQPVVLAAGVSQALITTAFGLIVGIPAMMFYAYFRRKAAKLVAYLEAASTDVLTALLTKRA